MDFYRKIKIPEEVIERSVEGKHPRFQALLEKHSHADLGRGGLP